MLAGSCLVMMPGIVMNPAVLMTMIVGIKAVRMAFNLQAMINLRAEDFFGASRPGASDAVLDGWLDI